MVLGHEGTGEVVEVGELVKDFKPGDKVIIPPPLTKAAADQRASEGYETVDWYFSKAPQPS